MTRPPASRQGALRRLKALYETMQARYDEVADRLGHTCADCPRNCCTSYFQHHTYIEWAWLHKGLAELSEERRREIEENARHYVAASRELVARGVQPALMCPINVDGLCSLYGHRLMICRLHGVPHTLAGRGGPQVHPGCWRCQDKVEAMGEKAPLLDRTPLYKELAQIEMAFQGKKRGRLPRVNLTLAEMIVQGPPDISGKH